MQYVVDLKTTADNGETIPASLTTDGEAIGYYDPDRTRFETRESAEIAAAGAAESGWTATVREIY